MQIYYDPNLNTKEDHKAHQLFVDVQAVWISLGKRAI